MARYQIQVSRPILARNKLLGRRDPPLIVRDHLATIARHVTMAEHVEILGPSSIVYHPTTGSAWIETDGPLELLNPRQARDEQD